MKITPACALTFLLATTPVFAAAATAANGPPTDASLHHLLDVMQARKVTEAVSKQMDAVFSGYMNKMLQGQQLNDRQREIIEKSRARLVEAFKGVLSWDAMEPLYLKVYAETFTQKEIDGMTAFYQSPTGRAMVEKMPLAMQNTMTEMQKRMEEVIPKIQQIARETADQIKADAAADPAGKSG